MVMIDTNISPSIMPKYDLINDSSIILNYIMLLCYVCHVMSCYVINYVVCISCLTNDSVQSNVCE